MERPTTTQVGYAQAIFAHYLATYKMGGTEAAQMRCAYSIHAAMGGTGKVAAEFGHIIPPKNGEGVTVDTEDFEGETVPPVDLYPGVTVNKSGENVIDLDGDAASHFTIGEGSYIWAATVEEMVAQAQQTGEPVDGNEEAEDDNDTDETPTAAQLNAMTKNDLYDSYREYFDNAEIEFSKSMSKDEMVKTILDYFV